MSPPASDFDLEGVAIIDMALDKYSKRKSRTSFTDSQLISKEIANRKSSTPQQGGRRRGRELGSFSSTGSSGEGVVMEAEPSGATAASYEAMLLTHARKASGTIPGVTDGVSGGDSGAERGVAGGVGVVSERVGSEEEEEDENKERYSIALDLNYEVRAAAKLDLLARQSCLFGFRSLLQKAP